MPTYTIQTPEGRKLKIEADDEAAALRGAQDWSRQNAGGAKTASKPAPKRSATEYGRGLMANVNRGLAIGDELAAAGSVVEGLATGRHRFGMDQPGNVLANNLNMLGTAYRNELAGQRQTEDRFTAEHPNAAALARGTGNALTAVVPTGQSANLLAQSPRLLNAARGAVTGGLTAAGFAATDRGTLRERAEGAARAARDPLALGVGAIAGALGPARASTRTPKPKISEDVVGLRERGVQLTPGQAKGGVAKAAEDAFTSTPILGTAIQEARGAGLESYNRAAGNEALSAVGESVPNNIQAGHETVAYVEKRLGDLYDETIPNRTVTADNEFKANISQRLGDIAQDMTDNGRRRLADILDQRVTGRVGPDGAVDGQTFQRMMSELSTVKKRFSGSQDADQRAIAEGIDVMQQEMRAAAARQDPDFAVRKEAVDQGWAMFSRLRDAASSPGAERGIATPAQFGGASRRADRSVGRGMTAKGQAYGQDFADMGRAVLPNKTPDSGTATRGAYATVASAPGAIIAGGMTGGPVGAASVAAGYGAALGGLKAASKAYSPEAIAAFNAALDGRISAQQQRAALSDLLAMARSDPAAAKLYQEAAARLGRAGSAIAGQRSGDAARANSGR